MIVERTSQTAVENGVRITIPVCVWGKYLSFVLAHIWLDRTATLDKTTLS